MEMNIAVAEALLDLTPENNESEIREKLIFCMKKWGRKYQYAGYGGRFSGWLKFDDTDPYNSYGNSLDQL